MTDKLIEQIKADREAGTDGPWYSTERLDGTYIVRQSSSDAVVCVIADGEHVSGEPVIKWPEQEANAHRIARIPDMEARILADDKIIKAAEELAEVMIRIANHPDNMDASLWAAQAITAYRAAVAEVRG